MKVNNAISSVQVNRVTITRW